MKKNLKTIILNSLTLTVFTATTALAASGDFTMSRRMVYGYENNTYTYSSSCNKKVIGSAKYSIDSSKEYNVLNGKLSASLYKKGTNILGSTKWSEVDYWSFSYYSSSKSFTLSEAVSLSSGTYGFTVWRAQDETYTDGEYITIKGNIKLS